VWDGQRDDQLASEDPMELLAKKQKDKEKREKKDDDDNSSTFKVGGATSGRCCQKEDIQRHGGMK
jgi:hypothetical protein